MKIKEIYSWNSVEPPLTIKDVKSGDIFKLTTGSDEYYFMIETDECFRLSNGYRIHFPEDTPVVIYDGTVMLDRDEWLTYKLV